MRKLIMEYASIVVAFLGSMGVLGIVNEFFIGESGFFSRLLYAFAQGGY